MQLFLLSQHTAGRFLRQSLHEISIKRNSFLSLPRSVTFHILSGAEYFTRASRALLPTHSFTKAVLNDNWAGEKNSFFSHESLAQRKKNREADVLAVSTFSLSRIVFEPWRRKPKATTSSRALRNCIKSLSQVHDVIHSNRHDDDCHDDRMHMVEESVASPGELFGRAVTVIVGRAYVSRAPLNIASRWWRALSSRSRWAINIACNLWTIETKTWSAEWKNEFGQRQRETNSGNAFHFIRPAQLRAQTISALLFHSTPLHKTKTDRRDLLFVWHDPIS